VSLVVAGGTVAALVAADAAAAAGAAVELLLPHRNVGGGFAPLRLGERRLDRGLRALELRYEGTGDPPPLEDYDAVLLGTSVLLGRHSKIIADYIRAHELQLASVPAFLFAVGGPGLPSSTDYVERMTRRTGWHPTASATFDCSEPTRDQILALARRVADEIPPAVLQPSLQ
jgi:hypothetical protein